MLHYKCFISLLTKLCTEGALCFSKFKMNVVNCTDNIVFPSADYRQDLYSGMSESVIGSPGYYTVVYSNTSMGQIDVCGSADISSSSCLNGVCISSLPSSCYNRNGNITVSVSAINVYGSGPNNSLVIGKKTLNFSQNTSNIGILLSFELYFITLLHRSIIQCLYS